MSSFLMSGSPEGKKKKGGGSNKKGADPLSPLEVTSPGGGEDCSKERRYNNNGHCLFVCTSVIRCNNQ